MIQNSEVIQEEIKILYAKNLLHVKKNQKHVIKGKHIFAIYIKQYKYKSFLKQEKSEQKNEQIFHIRHENHSKVQKIA